MTDANASARAALEAAHPEAECALHYRDAFELLVATILSAQCTDERVNKVTDILKEGDEVAKGDQLLIVEAMKTMNHIPSPRAGSVKRILVEDASAVEYGAPLMVVE